MRCSISHNKKLIKIIIAIVLIVLVCFFSIIVGNKLSYKESQPKQNLPENISRSEEVLVSLDGSEIVLTPISVDINMGFESKNPNEVHIDSTNYPKLFEPLDKFARLHVEEISGGDKSDIKLLRIARQIPDHGSLADSYFVVVDPEVGKVVDTGWEHFFGTVRFYNSCTSCSLPMLEFREYDREKQGYSLANNKHREEFIKLQKQHEQLGKKEKCRINGKEMLIEEALRFADANAKCADFMLGNKPSESFITVGEYRTILINIRRVINGENIKIFDRI